jgi:hypothetical protein
LYRVWRYKGAIGGVLHVPLAKESPRCPDHNVLFLVCDAKLWQGVRLFPHRARSHFYKRERLAVIPDQIDFALRSSGHIIAWHEPVTLPPQIPISVSLSSYACSERFLLFLREHISALLAQSSSRRPPKCLKIRIAKKSASQRRSTQPFELNR